MTSVESERRAPRDTAENREPTPRLLMFLAFVIPALPTVVVLPGPLRGNGSPARLLAFVCLGLVVLAFTFPKGRRSNRINIGAILLVTFFFLQFLTFGTGLLELGNENIDAHRIRTVVVFVSYLGVGLYTIKTVTTTRQRSLVIGSLVAGMTFACIVGIFQGFNLPDLRFLLMPPGFVQVADADTVSTRGAAVRAMGTSSHAIEFSIIAAVAVVLSFHLARFATKSLHRQLAWCACVIAFIAVPTAVSRSGALTLVVAFLVYMFALSVRQLVNVVVFALSGLLAYRVVSPGALASLMTTILGSNDDASIQARIEDYAEVAEQFRRDPLFGLGLGGNPLTDYRVLDNQWLGAIVQGGIVGLSALTLLSVGAMAGMTAALRTAKSRRDRDQAFALGATIIGIVVSMATFDLFSFSQATFIFFLLFGLIWSAAGRTAIGRPAPHPNATDTVTV